MNRLSTAGIAAAIFVFGNLFFTAPTASAQEEPQEAPSIKDMKGLEADALYYDAVRSRLKGDEKEAEALLNKVLALKPDASGAYYDLARINMPDKPDKATEYIKKAMDMDKDNIWYQQQYAEILAYKNRYDEAADVYSKISAQERYNDEYLLKASLFYQRSGKYKEALQMLDKLLEKTGEDEEYLYQKQQLYLKMNDVAGAAKTIERMIEKNPQEGRYYALLAEVYDNNKEEKKAEETYKRAEKMFGDDPVVLIGIAEHYKRNNDTLKYNDYLKKALLSKSLDAETQLTLLVSYMQDAKTEAQKKEGLDIAGKIADQHQNDAQVLGVYGDLLSLNGEREAAVVQYKKSLRLEQSKYLVWQNMLYNLTEKKDTDSLLYYSEKAMRLFPNQAMLHYLNGVAYFNKKDYNKAVKALSRAIDMVPEDNTQQLADMYQMIGDVYNLMDEHTKSDSSYEQALRLNPDNASVLNNYSYYLSVRGVRLGDAEKMSKRSLDLRPDEATFLDTYGWILYKEGKYESAKGYIQKAVDLSKETADGTLFEHLGDVCFKLGDKDKALQYWKLAKEKGTENVQIDKKIQDQKLYE
jgi:tetratricopeptide (TPR) repeat protein